MTKNWKFLLKPGQFDRDSSGVMAFFVIPLALFVFMLRPSIVGGRLSVLGAAGIIISALAFFLFIGGRRSPSQFPAYGVLVCGSLLMLYLLIQAAICDSRKLDIVMQIFVVNSVILWCLGFMLADKIYNQLFYRFIVYVFALVGFSSFITTMLFLFLPDKEVLLLFSFPVRGYEHIAKVYFPFSVLCGDTPYGTIVLSRFTGLFREPGIHQAFASWAIVYAVYNKLHKLVVVGLILSILTTYSTAGIANLLLIPLGWLLFEGRHSIGKRLLIIVVAVIAIMGSVYYMPHVGIRDKSLTHEKSILERVDKARLALDDILTNPFGEGYFNTTLDSAGEDNASINLIAASRKIGLFGAVLVLTLFISPLFTLKENVKIKLLSLLPVILTLLVAQPLFDQPLAYIVLFPIFEKNRTNCA